MSPVPLMNLGQTGLKVSRLGFGTFDFGVASNRISPNKGALILERAHGLGITYWDTSDDYGSHSHVAEALKLIPRDKVVISTKTYAKTGLGAKRSLIRSLRELGADYVDVFLLHFVRANWAHGCRRVLKGLGEAKKEGLVRAVGLSTHSVKVAKEASRFNDLDVMMAICCSIDERLIRRFPEDIPLEDGSIKEMMHAIEAAHNNGIGTIAIKVLGNGATPIARNYRTHLQAIASVDYVDTLVIGMRDFHQVRKNVNSVIHS